MFGMQHTVIKFYSGYKTDKDKDSFLWTALIIPLIAIVPLALLGTFFYEGISTLISEENNIIKEYTYLIFIVGLVMGYFEIFYAWTKVQFNSVFGNVLKELFARICSSILIVCLAFGWISDETFIYAIVIVYGLRTLIMAGYAFYIHMPKFSLKLPENLKEIISFSSYMIVAGSAAGILLEIDKAMIPQMEKIAEVAYYAVGVYIASVIAIPTRAMQQITNPITAKGMNTENRDEVETLYRQTSLNLLVIGGLLFLCINLNISDLYELINKPQYTKGIWIVLIVSFAKMMELAMGTGNAILVNSKYFKIFFYLSLAMAVSVVLLNHWLIGLFGINGAALATLIVIVVYNIIKLIYINSRLGFQPFSIRTVKILALTGALYVTFNFIEFSFHPILNIVLKSCLLGLIYVFIVLKFKISDELTGLWKSRIQ
jgi:O-antigen/teichoic acid export membrane protein